MAGADGAGVRVSTRTSVAPRARSSASTRCPTKPLPPVTNTGGKLSRMSALRSATGQLAMSGRFHGVLIVQINQTISPTITKIGSAESLPVYHGRYCADIFVITVSHGN